MGIRQTRDGRQRRAVTLYIEVAAHTAFSARAKVLGSPWTPSALMAGVLEREAKELKRPKSGGG